MKQQSYMQYFQLLCRGKQALLIVQKVLQQADMQELALFSLIATPGRKQLKIRLDKVSCCLHHPDQSVILLLLLILVAFEALSETHQGVHRTTFIVTINN